MDFVNAKENSIYLWNLAHLVSVLVDNIIFSCGDLLPLLSSVTSRDYTQDVIEPCGGMTLETSFSFLNRLMSLVDVIVFTSSLAFSGVESNRNMSAGGFLRQCLRLGKFVKKADCQLIIMMILLMIILRGNHPLCSVPRSQVNMVKPKHWRFEK